MSYCRRAFVERVLSVCVRVCATMRYNMRHLVSCQLLSTLSCSSSVTERHNFKLSFCASVVFIFWEVIHCSLHANIFRAVNLVHLKTIRQFL